MPRGSHNMRGARRFPPKRVLFVGCEDWPVRRTRAVLHDLPHVGRLVDAVVALFPDRAEVWMPMGSLSREPLRAPSRFAPDCQHADCASNGVGEPVESWRRARSPTIAPSFLVPTLRIASCHDIAATAEHQAVAVHPERCPVRPLGDPLHRRRLEECLDVPANRLNVDASHPLQVSKHHVVTRFHRPPPSHRDGRGLMPSIVRASPNAASHPR